MSRDFLCIGRSPCKEQPEMSMEEQEEQEASIPIIGSKQKMISECTAFINQLRRECGNEPSGSTLSIRLDDESAQYYEVTYDYDDANQIHADYGFALISSMPEKWDDAAKRELVESKTEWSEGDAGQTTV